MSISYLLDEKTGSETWKNLYVNNLTVNGTLTTDGGSRTVAKTFVYGDSLGVFPTVPLSWPTKYAGLYPNAGTVTNKCVNGLTIQTACPVINNDIANSVIQSGNDAIVWLGYNNWSNQSYTDYQVRNLAQSICSFAMSLILKPTSFRLSDPNLTHSATIINTEAPAIPLIGDAGIQTTVPLAGNTQWVQLSNINTRYVYVQFMINSSSTEQQLYCTWSIDGSSTESTSVQLPNEIPNLQFYPFDLLIDRGESKIGVTTELKINNFVGSPNNVTTRWMFYKCFDTIPTDRCTVVSPWNTWNTSTHALGTPQLLAGVDFVLRNTVKSYSDRGFNMRYAEIPTPLSGDMNGEGSITVHPSSNFTPVLAKAIGDVALSAS